MITRVVNARSLRANRRLDCKYFLASGTYAAERLTVAAASGIELRTIGGHGGLGRVTAPVRFKRCYAAKGEASVPYLRPYDVFDYVPTAADFLSAGRSANLAELMAPPGALLQTCSGRNLGPATVVDAYLGRFALSHDLIRIDVDAEINRFYLLAFLASPTGQDLVRRDKTGSVIDHISVGHIANVPVPIVSRDLRAKAARRMRRAVKLREEARITLAGSVDALAARLPSVERLDATKAGWTVAAQTLGDRVDAAFHDPLVARVRRDLVAMGGQPIREMAKVEKPGGRYKTYYVDEAHGRPLLSGRQLLQYWPVNLQFIAPRSLDPTRYEVQQSWIAFQADGRSEERLGLPVMIEPERDRWLASAHIGRLIPHHGVDAGWLYAACSTDQVQLQMKALACGSVVDALYVEDIEQVVLPPRGTGDGARVSGAWAKFTAAAAAQAEAVAIVEDELTRLTGVTRPTASQTEL